MDLFLFLFLAANVFALGHAMGRAKDCPTWVKSGDVVYEV